MTALLLAALLAVEPWQSLADPDRAARILQLKSEPLLERVVSVSDQFLGTPYVLSPLGEGEGRDPDPLIRFDAVDCVTMVEETLALSLTPDDGALVATLSRLRYAGSPAWEARNHVMEAQWLPQNIEKGFLRDVTRQWGGDETRRVTKALDAKTWQQKAARALELPPAAQPRGTFALDVIPAAAALARLAKVPAGTLVVVVRADRPSLVTRVSHVGILVQSKQGPLLRHASRSFGKVVDEPLARYLKRNLDFASWTVEGLALFEPQEPPRAAPP